MGPPRGIPQLTTTFAGDGRRIVVSRPASTFEVGPHMEFLATVDGTTWTPITMNGGMPDDVAFAGTMVGGPRGVALVPGRLKGLFAQRAWCGSAPGG